jgi:uncharacterized damage-inducible protein DinB
LIHVLFHSAYHRGQIALQMRASGLTPAYTDFIHAVRQGSLRYLRSRKVALIPSLLSSQQ